MERLLSVHEISVFLGLKIPTIYKFICAKKIPYIKLGGRVMFDPEKIKSWLEEKQIEPVK